MLALMPDLSLVLGKSFALCGAGCSATQDRLFARRVIHYAQGIRDPDHNPELAGRTDRTRGPPFLFFGNDAECLEFGKRTQFALKSITLICPCIIAPPCANDQRVGVRVGLQCLNHPCENPGFHDTTATV